MNLEGIKTVPQGAPSIDLSEVGAFATATPGGFQIKFGVYLPGVRGGDGFKLKVKVIHADDRFDPQVPTTDQALSWNSGHPLDLWSGTMNIATGRSHFGSEGLYLYRFQLTWGANDQIVTNWFTDPFAMETDVGSLSAVTLARSPTVFEWTDANYKTPELGDLIVYELEAEQFNGGFEGVINRLTYLQSLGVNCVELMPVTSPKLDFDWGYGPLHYFAPSRHIGGPEGLKRLVDACHQRGMAVILDVVDQHVDPSFPYALVYANLSGVKGAPKPSSPMIGTTGPFGPQCDFSQTFTQQYFAAANQHWLSKYHVDGFRYDEVTDLYDGPTGTAYAKLAYDTYQSSLNMTRFQPVANSYSRIIQCAEALGKAPDVLRNTYGNSAWQDDLLNLAEGIARGDAPSDSLAHTLDPLFGDRYPANKMVNNAAGQMVEMPVAPFQYLNSHDHSHLVVFAGTSGSGAFPFGDRSRLWRMQPLAIALYTSQGVPMLWEGEEFADNYNLPSDGSERTSMRRDTHWEYFYDDYGIPLMRLYRRLAALRRNNRALRSRESFYYWQQSLQNSQLIAYHRHAPASGADAEQFALVILNFASYADTIQVPFPKAGTWTEQLDADPSKPAWTVKAGAAGEIHPITVPSNYGCIFLL